jgi:hypothetical protein
MSAVAIGRVLLFALFHALRGVFTKTPGDKQIFGDELLAAIKSLAHDHSTRFAFLHLFCGMCYYISYLVLTKNRDLIKKEWIVALRQISIVFVVLMGSHILKRPETQALLADAYANVARELDAILAPVGLAWQRVQRLIPGLDLYHPDGRHANPIGSYLTACVFYAMVFNASPQGLPGDILVEDKVRLDLDKGTARCLQKIAFDTVNNSEFGRRKAE